MAKSAHQILHGKTLAEILEELVQAYGWPRMAQTIEVRCFMFDPSITSSLRFLRKTPWAREKVEALYVKLQRDFEAEEPEDEPHADMSHEAPERHEECQTVAAKGHFVIDGREAAKP